MTPSAAAGQGQGLRRAEAQERAELLTVASYDVDLDLTRGEELFGSTTTVRFSSQGGATFLDVKPARLHEAVLDGVPLDVGLLDRGRLPLETIPGDHELVVVADMAYRHDGEGLHRHVDPADGRAYVYAMSFMDAGPRWFACFDQPDLKAPYAFSVLAPADWVVVGNAPATSPEPGRWRLGPTPPLSTYTVTLVGGPYHLLRSEHDGIALGLSARASLAAALDREADELFTMTGQCFDEMHRLFGIRYPYGDYHQAFVPEFNAGAMENPGCITFRDELVFPHRATRGMRTTRASTVAHEMAHQWFGNLTTPLWWDDLWLNESFAEYVGVRVTGAVTAYADVAVDMSYARRQWGLLADARPSTHPVAGNGADEALAALQDFDGISYVKGANVLRQLARTLGDDAFFGGVRDHLERHRYGNATMADLFGAWQDRAPGFDLPGFAHAWLRTSGPDRLRLDRDAGLVRRTPPPSGAVDRVHRVEVAIARPDGDWERRPLEIGGEGAALDAGDRAVLVDPDEASWAEVLPDPVTLAALPGLLPRMTDPMLRAATWNSVRSAMRYAAVAPAQVVDLVVAALPVEDPEDAPQRAVPRRTLAWVVGTLLPLAPAGSTERVHRAALDVVAAAAPGSERQLVGFRVAVATATDGDVLRGWLDAPPPGLDADLDLRWRALVRLAILGATDRSGLDAALAADPATEAALEHARAVASLPDPEAKAWAWQRFTGEADAAGHELEAIGLGMWRAGQEDLTRPYVQRYFDEVAATTAVRAGWTLALGAEAFFPMTALDDETLAQSRALIARDDLDSSIRRTVVDVADELEHRLAVGRAFPR